MITRSRRETVVFLHPAQMKGVDRVLAAGSYEIIIDEEMIEGLSFPCYRRTATMIMVPGVSQHQHAMQMLPITSVDLADAQQRDAVASHG